MNWLVTGGAGFIGRFVVKNALSRGDDVWALDDLSNGRRENVRDFESHQNFKGLIEADIKNPDAIERVFANTRFDVVAHLGASIHVQKSIDDPEPTFRNDAEGTFRILEACRKQFFAKNGLNVEDKHFDFEKHTPQLKHRAPRVAVMSTCMVYDATSHSSMSETHPYRPASPYAAAKIASDNLALSYAHAYKMPVTVVRPFNTYGPFQKSNSEGGVVSIFLKRDISREPLLIKGTGLQTRDLLYVEDCAEFVVRAALSEKAEAHIINAGTGADVSIRTLAEMCLTAGNKTTFVAHDHPQAEIMRLCCNSSKAREILNWQPSVSLEEGLRRTRSWLVENKWAW